MTVAPPAQATPSERYFGWYRSGASVSPGYGAFQTGYAYNFYNFADAYHQDSRLGLHEIARSGKYVYKVRGWGKVAIEHAKMYTRAVCGNSDYITIRLQQCLVQFSYTSGSGRSTPTGLALDPLQPIGGTPKPPGCTAITAATIAQCWVNWADYVHTPTQAAEDPIVEELLTQPMPDKDRLVAMPVEQADKDATIEAFEVTSSSTATSMPRALRIGRLNVNYGRAILAGTAGRTQIWAALGSDKNTVCLLAVSQARKYGTCGALELAAKNGFTLAYADSGAYTVVGLTRGDVQTVRHANRSVAVRKGFFILRDVKPAVVGEPILGLSAAGRTVAGFSI